jgi:hypothetical protein
MDERGHETALFSMDHGEAPAFTGRSYRIPYVDFKDPNAGLLKKVRMAAHAIYSPSARRAMRKCVADFSPDLAHVRGIYHHLSPSILVGTEAAGHSRALSPERFQNSVPNLQLRCRWPRLRAMRERRFLPRRHGRLLCGAAFERGRSRRRSLLHKWLRTYERCVDLFLAPSEFVRKS